LSSPTKLPRTKLPPTVWNKIEAEANIRRSRGQEIFALHIGDTWLPFPTQLTEPIPNEEILYGTRLNRYSDTFGDRPLRELILEKVSIQNGLPVTGIENIQVTSGATSVLQAAFARLLDPGSEVLTLSPYWSILRNVADAARVKLVEVPFFDQLSNDVASLLEPFVSTRTEGIYLNTPSNPTGLLLDRATLEELARFAEKHDLWIFADEAYEDYIWDGSPHVSIGSFPGMFDRTISVYTFSKCFGASGMRVGYAVGEASVISQINRAVVGNYYQPPRLGQLHAWRGMKRFGDALNYFRKEYAPAFGSVREHLDCEFLPAVGGFYFFVKLPAEWAQLTPEAKVDLMLDYGVVLAPGEYFGESYRSWARMCFTILPPAEMNEAVHRLNRFGR
jgi:aspartate/methionine/tyrosine aminotransferase